MAIIEIRSTGEKIVLHQQHSIGRNCGNVTVLPEDVISRKHAVVYWENNHWHLTDISSNGTLVNNVLVHHSTCKLKKNDIIQFSYDNDNIWKLIKDDAPKSYFKELINSQNIIEIENGFILQIKYLKYSLFKDKMQNWVMDDGLKETQLVSGNTYFINNKEYLFTENESQHKTLLNMDITKNACIHLVLSNDEESVFAEIKVNDFVINLGNRSYNHLLLYLARKKQIDLSNKLNNNSSGWTNIEDVSKSLSKEMLRDVDEYYINNLIFRYRKRLSDAHPYGHLFAHTIERKKGTIRLSFNNFEVEKEHLFA